MDDILNLLSGLTLAGIPLIVLIPLIVEGLKKLGLPTHWTGFASIIVSVIAFLFVGLVKEWPRIDPWVTLAVAAIVVGLGANGTYSQAKLFKKGNPTHPGEAPQVVGAPTDNRHEP